MLTKAECMRALGCCIRTSNLCTFPLPSCTPPGTDCTRASAICMRSSPCCERAGRSRERTSPCCERTSDRCRRPCSLRRRAEFPRTRDGQFGRGHPVVGSQAAGPRRRTDGVLSDRLHPRMCLDVAVARTGAVPTEPVVLELTVAPTVRWTRLACPFPGGNAGNSCTSR